MVLRRGTSLIGLMITLVCILVMAVLLMTSMNKAVTGEGSAVQGTVRSVEDQMRLKGLFLGLTTYGQQNRNAYPVPSEISGSGDIAENTTANFYSAMIAQNYVQPNALVASNEYSSWVEVDEDYDYNAYQPRSRVFWDPAFKADLTDISNVSFAHMPMHGERFERHWSDRMRGNMPLIGNRGPRDGIDNTLSLTYGRNEQWAGHVLYSDGSIDFIETFTPQRVTYTHDGVSQPDNIFAAETGLAGSDALLGFTIRMTENGPELQWD